MNYQELCNAISRERVERYLIAADNDEDRAVKLYFEAQILASKLFLLISSFEIDLRNKINSEFSTIFNSGDWLLELGQTGSRLDRKATLDTFNQLVGTIQRIKKNIRDRGCG